MLSAQIIGRSAGRSATASAAYRAGTVLRDERSGLGFDYTHRSGVVRADILAPDGVPDWMRDRQQLWNAVEKGERRKDSQLARELLLALPHELTADQRHDLARGFVQREFVDRGMIADLAIHLPDREGDDRNHHAHVMLTMRALTGAGFGNKARQWNDDALLQEWREHWAVAVNQELEQHGHAARVDHRSNAARGLDREPEPKQGPVATDMERQGKPSHAGDDRRAVQARNAERAALEQQAVALMAEITELTADEQRRQEAQAATEQAAAAALVAEQVRKDAIEKTRRQALAAMDAMAVEEKAAAVAKLEADQLDQLRRQQERADEYLAEQQREAEQARRQEEEQTRQRQTDTGRAADPGIRDAGSRYAQALGQEYDVSNPYQSLARAAMAEHGMFHRDREALNQEIAKTDDAEQRKQLELRRDIEAAEHLAQGHHRLARIHETITGKPDDHVREQAERYASEAVQLREQHQAGQEHAQERARREAAETGRTQEHSREPKSAVNSREKRHRALEKQLALEAEKEQERTRERGGRDR